MAEDTRERSTTTVLEKSAAGTLAGTDILYLIQGTGSDRDRTLTLAVLLAWIKSNFGDEVFERITVQGENSFPCVIIDKDGVTVARLPTT